MRPWPAAALASIRPRPCLGGRDCKSTSSQSRNAAHGPDPPSGTATAIRTARSD